MFDHVKFGVSDYAASKAFFLKALEPRGGPMASVASVQAVADGGLAGDRYAETKNRPSPDYQVTLIELENIEAFVVRTGLTLTPEQPRRNIVTRGISLNSLCGKRFKV